MSTAPAPRGREGDASSASHRRRRRVVHVAAAILAAAIIVFATMLTISDASDGEVSVLIGTLGSDQLAGIAVVAGLSAVAVALCAIPVSRLWLLLMVPARLAAIGATTLAALVWGLTSPATVVPLVSAGCDTGYVVREQSFLRAGFGTVYRTNGVLVTAVVGTSGDDGSHPFHAGDYAVQADEDSLRVWYPLGSDPAALATDRDPTFTLPKLGGRTAACGIIVAAPTPVPTPPPPPVYDVDDVHASVDEMVDRSLAGALGPIEDAAGNSFDPRALAVESTPCGDGGTQFGVALDFASADNASSLTRILAIWSQAGYARDRASHEDIRYSATLPIMTMSIRDSTTIDGLIHMRITSQCGGAP